MPPFAHFSETLRSFTENTERRLLTLSRFGYANRKLRYSISQSVHPPQREREIHLITMKRRPKGGGEQSREHFKEQRQCVPRERAKCQEITAYE